MVTPRRPQFPTPRHPVSKIGPVSTDRNIAQSHDPSADRGQVDGRTLIYTYFTSIPNVGEATPVLYNGDRLWARITLTLENAGPVAVGTMSGISPVLSGKGELLETGEPLSFDIYKGTRLYILATGINRVKVQVQPIPWLEMITGLLARLVGAIGGHKLADTTVGRIDTNAQVPNKTKL